MTPSQIGERAELAVAHALAQAGKHVLWPLSASQRYDLVFEDEDGFHRVQVKAGRVVSEAVLFRVCSQTANVQRDYKGEVDYFGIYCHERREVYLVPIDDVPGKAAMLRLAPPRNGQAKGIRWAQNYLLREVTPAYVA